ncbi:MAG TPA: arginine deiminase family protein [Bryobacteraceae bacterium]|nr:arginine deiminase family protein [Bryobacteraceae bacterium]
MLTAITRAVSPSLNQCELGYLPRQAIDIAKAEQQHRAYEACLSDLGVRVISLPAEPDLPDSMFVEDPAVVVDEVAVMTRMGAESRRGESESLAAALSRYRPLRWMQEPATLEGGDVLRIGSKVFVGLSRRTNAEGVAQLACELEPLGYSVQALEVHGCLHLKSACCALGDGTVLVNRSWIDSGLFETFRVIDVPKEEPHAANVLAIGDAVLVASAFPRTAELLANLDWKPRVLDISELMKAEAGLTCSSIVFEADSF